MPKNLIRRYFYLGAIILSGFIFFNLENYSNSYRRFINFDSLFIRKSGYTYIKVKIYGRIKYQGIYKLREGSKLKDLISKAGGYLPDAYTKLSPTILLKDGEEYFIPYRKLRKGEYININTAGIEELCRLPYVNTKLAEEIIKYREKYDRFDQIEELIEIDGIGEKKFKKIKNFVIIGE